MKPEKKIALCPDCVRYLQCFMSVASRKGRRLSLCRSCGRWGLHKVYDLAKSD